MRTLIYARYSSTLQNARSIDDQIAVCRERADSEGWDVVEVYTDYAISGAAGIGDVARPGLSACLARIEAGGIDQLLTESTDRLARHQGDAYAIRERINFAGARIFTLFDGEVDDITGTIKSLFDARFRKDLGERIKRGQRGAVGEGRAPAGLAFGYRRANRLDDRGELVRGLREIDADEADIVRRIFREYDEGASARTIAHRLNDDGVPGPRGGQWQGSSIRGDRIRGNGLLRNRLYAGELVHNRTRKVVDPRTRRTLIKPNPESAWIVEAVPALAIVDRALFDRVQVQLAEREGSSGGGAKSTRQVRPRRLLSGMVKCGVCGGPINVVSPNYWGCARRRDGASCTNNRTISTRGLESRVLHGLQDGMLDPAVVSAYVREYHRDYAKNIAEAGRSRARLERQIADAAAKIDRLVDAIGRGADIEEVREALAQARADREAAQAALQEMKDLPVVALHPRIADDYREKVAELSAMVAAGAYGEDATARIRSLIDRVVAVPAEKGRGMDIRIEGRLDAILALATGAPAPAPLMLSVERVKGRGRKHKLLRAKA